MTSIDRYNYAFDPEGDAWAARLLRRLPPQGDVLELGPGPGAMTRVMVDRGYRVTVVENDPGALKCLEALGVEVIAADKAGVLHQLAEFFVRHGITVEQLQSTRYKAMQTGADMFSAQITIGIPASTHIAGLRDDFLEFCDG
ncbi:MAG TPA: rRNA adenine N-6-methyltransferase family protein, partial [Aestuariivirga sp.]|nr:rRNA adenine N-6-methyltransferase family protein [Aestuariivirga sp.]